MIRYVDATDSPDERIDYPEIVAELLDLGFEKVGRVLAEPTEGTYEDIVATYDPSQARDFLDHCDVPATVLRAPDGTAFVDIAWFWDSPSVRFRTELADGAVAETHRRWTFRPGLPLILEEHWTNFDIDADMMKRSTPGTGRSTVVIKTNSARDQWALHREHVAAYTTARSTTGLQHRELNHYIYMSERLFAHDAAVERRMAGLWKPLILSYGVVGLLIVLGTFLLGFEVPAILLAILFAIATMPVVRLVLRTRILPVRLRPPFL